MHYKPSTYPELTTRVPTSSPISLVPQNFGTFLRQISQFIIPLSFSKFPHSLDVLLYLPLVSLFIFSTHLFRTKCCTISIVNLIIMLLFFLVPFVFLSDLFEFCDDSLISFIFLFSSCFNFCIHFEVEYLHDCFGEQLTL